MTVGIGACLAEQASNGTITSSGHQENIRRAVFSGATGRIVFGGGSQDEVGVRDPSTVLWGEFNVLPPHPERNETIYFDITGIYEPDAKDWRQVKPFVYRDGRTVPPDLRDQADQNFLSSGLRAMGLSLMIIVVLAAVVCVLWVFLRRKHRVLKASQPVFLYLIAFGAAVEATAIYTLSNDERYGWSAESLSRACMATPWLMSTGRIIIYSSLFTKLWRVNQVLQFSRRKVKIRHVAGPMAMIVLAALLVLSLWTALDPLKWLRTSIDIDDVSGESIGRCSSNHFVAFMIPLVFLMIIPIALTAFMAWKTMDVDEQFVESKWIFAMILVQIEVVIVAVPVVFILRDVSTDGRYLGFVFLLWIFPMSTLLLIFLPKFVAYNRAIRGVDTGAQRVRGRPSGLVVTGLPAASIVRPPNASSVHNKPPCAHDVTMVGAFSAPLTDSKSEASAVEESKKNLENDGSNGAAPIAVPNGGNASQEYPTVNTVLNPCRQL